MVQKFSKSLYDFVAYLDAQKNLSLLTREAYRYDLERFSNFMIQRLGKMPPPDQITSKQLEDYLEYHQLQKRLKGTTLSRIISSLRVFFEYCASKDILKENPAQYLHNPKIAKKLPSFLTQSELLGLFQAPDQTTPQGIRDYAILVALSFTGMRLSELVGLNIDHVDLISRNIRIFGKGAKERMVPLNEVVVQALNGYLTVRPNTETKALFLNRFNNRLGGRGVENIVKKYVLASGIRNMKISPHKLRHTFATLLHLSEVDLIEIQALMGHADISSTQIYTHTNPGRMKGAVEKLEKLSE